MTHPPVRHPPVTHPPVTHPPTKPGTKPPPTDPSTNPASHGPPVTLPPPTPVAAVEATARLETFYSFQTFVKGLEANANRNRVRALAPQVPFVGPAPISALITPAASPALLPPGPLFHDTPVPLLPLGASGLRSARSFVFLFGLSALALGFLAVRSRLARRHGAFVNVAIDEHGDYVEFV